MKDLAYVTNDTKFSVRAAGLIFNRSRILLCHFDSGQGDSFWFMPGGKVKLMESAREAVVRELREELSEELICGDLIWVAESFLSTAPRAHEIAFYFRASLPSSSTLLTADGDISSQEPGSHLTFRWVQQNKVADLDLRPHFVKESLIKNQLEFRHIVCRDDD